VKRGLAGGVDAGREESDVGGTEKGGVKRSAVWGGVTRNIANQLQIGLMWERNKSSWWESVV